ncbi:MAG: fibrobacter succinogenes major paralogous domain-containing protein, partial [Bacteroidota bacterium]
MKNLIPFFIVLFVIIFISSCSEDKTLPNSKPAKTSYPSLSEKETDSTILIGTQVWMKKNLDVDHYRNGDTIPEVKDPKIWAKLKTGAWCYYGNSLDEGKIYGKLYNWFAVNDPRGLAPAGWHIPTDTEWTTLTSNLGGESGAGGKMKSKGTLEGDDGLWFRPNTGASNESGFSALPGGWRG